MPTDQQAEFLATLLRRAGISPQRAAQVPMEEAGEAGVLTRVWPLLEDIRARGGVVVVKLDGERGPQDTGPYTAVISGEQLFGDDFFRADGATVAEVFCTVLSRCADRLWPDEGA